MALTDILTLFGSSPTTNASYYFVVGAFLHNWLSGSRPTLIKRGLDNNVEPRENFARLEKSGKISPAELARLRRASAAQANGFESLMMMAAAAVAGNQANLGASFMNRATGLYLLFRVVFTHLYVSTTTRKKSLVRSVVWLFGVLCYVTTFIKAGRALNA